MEKEIEKKATTLIKRFIKKDTDPIGLRKLGRTHVRKMEQSRMGRIL